MHSHFRCIQCSATYPLDAFVYQCKACNALLEVEHAIPKRDYKSLFATRHAGAPGPDGSGVWRYREWVLPDVPQAHIVTLGEGHTPLLHAERQGQALDIRLLVKQCGHTHTGSFKDLGMTALVSQVNHMRHAGQEIRAVICASTGDTSAALAAYAAAADLRCVVLLPKGKISAAQMIQPLAHGARVVAIDTDFDGCMEHVQKLAQEPGVYLANSKNSLRIEGQKTVAFEIAQGLGWNLPDWVAIPGGNLGNVAALVKGFQMLRDFGLTHHLPRVLCAQAAVAAPLYQAYKAKFAPLQPVVAGPTQASAIRIGNPVSFPKAVAALQACNGVVESVTEQELTQTAWQADQHGLYLCPHTSVALAAVAKQRRGGAIQKGQTVVVVSTAHGLKFTEFKTATAQNQVPGATLQHAAKIHEVPHIYADVRKAALD